MSNFAEEIVRLLQSEAQCQKAFGVSGGFIYALWLALHSSSIDVYHCRSEAGAAFAAMEHSLHTKSVGLLFTTCGPGIANAYTALRTARTDGARMVVLSAITSESEVGNPRPIQETTTDWVMTATNDSFQYPFSESIIVRDRTDLVHLARRLQALRRAPAGGCLGVFISLTIQKTATPPLSTLEITPKVEYQPKGDVSHWAHYLSAKLRSGNCIIWAGSGVKEATEQLRRVVEHYSTPVMTTPRAKGVFPENHKLSLGCTGTWGNVTAATLRSRLKPGGIVIVLGSRLESMSSAFIQLQCMSEWELIAVDLHPGHVRRNLPPHALLIEAEINSLLDIMARDICNFTSKREYDELQSYSIPRDESKQEGRLHPGAMMSVVQELMVDTHNHVIIGDCGNTLAWTTRLLRINKPGRFRLTTHESPMGYAACGAVGIGACGVPVLAIVGDGALLLQNEISTAVHHRLPVIWLVLNDSLYNMCEQGLVQLGASGPDCTIPENNFALYGQSLGAIGFVAKSVTELEDSLQRAIEKNKPTVIDARIDGSVLAPLGSRVDSLARE